MQRISPIMGAACKTPGLRLGTGLYFLVNTVVLDCRLRVLVPADRRQSQRGGNRRFRRAFQRVWGHRWMADAGRAPGWDGGGRRRAGYVTRRTSWSAVSASTPNMQWHITFEAPRTRTWRPPNSSLSRPLTRSPGRAFVVPNLLGKLKADTLQAPGFGSQLLRQRLVAAGVDVNQRDVAEVSGCAAGSTPRRRRHPSGRTDWSSARRTGSPGEWRLGYHAGRRTSAGN